MGDTLMVIIVIGLTAVLMFVFPMMTMSDRADDISQQVIETEVTDTVNNVRTSAEFTREDYAQLVESISATGNSYDIEMEWGQLDENPAKKTTQTDSTKIGENRYVWKYTSEIMEELDEKGQILLKEGDIFVMRLKNSNTTISHSEIAAEHAGIVTTDAN